MKKVSLFIFLLLYTAGFVFCQCYVDLFSFPVEEKYRNSISSDQGLREILKAEDTGGLDTSGLWHNGIDFIVPDKTPVYAAKDGIIDTVYPSYYNGAKWKGNPVYGGLIIIKHNDNTISLYAHLSLTEVSQGDEVKAGDRIGLSGGVKGRRGSGVSTGPHLHFSIYIDFWDFLEVKNQ